ncbi:MAG: BACON domain-containing protein [Rudaea sp.]
MKTKFNILMIIALVAGLVGANPGGTQASVNAAPVAVGPLGSVNVAPASPTLTAVDPLVYYEGTDVIPARPFLYSVDANGLTITRFNDNAVVGTWPWPDELWITLPDGGQMAIPKPAGGWEPVSMMVSAPTETDIGNRNKQIPDLTPPFTFVYVVMAHSGYEWASAPDATLQESPNVRDHLVPSTNPDTESSVLIQINVNDPSFSSSRDSAAPVDPHVAGAILGHGAGQLAYDPRTGNVYVGNQPSGSLPAGLTSFVSVIGRIPDTVASSEREIPGIGQPVIRCGPQHPESGIPVGKPQAYACYDPGTLHIINDNEHVGGYEVLEDRDADGTLDQQYVWEFRNLPDWLTAHKNPITNEYDGVLYGTPPATGEWYGEARVHDLDDEWGIFSNWHPIRLLVTPTAEYLAISNQFAVGTAVAYPLEGTGSCALTGAPAWVESFQVPNGCVVTGRAPISGEHYSFDMPGFRQAGYPDIALTFSGNVVGGYGFVPLTEGVSISGLGWHQISKVADPSTETAVLSAEFVGVDPSTGQLYRILQVPGQPQPPNERPAETAIKTDAVSTLGAPLTGSGFGQVVVEADRDIYVGASGAVIKVSGGTATTISLPEGMQASSLSLDSDLRTAIPGVEPGQVDHGALWVAGAGNVALIDTDAASVAQSFTVPGASSVTVDFGPSWAYVATGSNSLAIFGPAGSTRPPMEPRIWSYDEITFNRGYPGAFRLMATGDPLPTLGLLGDMPEGLTYTDLGNGFSWVEGTPALTTGGDGYAYAVTAMNAVGSYAQALGITIYGPTEFLNTPEATFTAGSASAYMLQASSVTAPILYTWDEDLLPPGVLLMDNEDGTATVAGIATTPGTYTFTIGASTGYIIDPTEVFTLNVNPAGTAMPPVINSPNMGAFETLGAPFAPDVVSVAATGSPMPTLSIVTKEGQTGLPLGVNFIDNGDSTGTLGSGCVIPWPGWRPDCLALLPEGTQPGTYTFTIRAENSDGVADQEFTLILDTATSIMTPGPDAPANLSFAYTPGGPTPPAQTFVVGTLGDTLPYAAVTTARWLEASPKSGTVPGDLTVTVDPTGLLPGTYTGTVLVTSTDTDGPFATAFVTLTVVDVSTPGQLGVFPGALNFRYQVGGAWPAAQSLLMMSGGVPLDYTVSTGDAKWLSASAGGTAPSLLNVSVDPRVGVGMHIGGLKIAYNGPEGPQLMEIPVTLVKTAGDTDLIQVMFDVGSGPEGIAANLTTHNLFITSSNAAAEAAEAGEATTVVETAGPPDPALVFHVNPVDKTVVGEVVMHGEAEYVAVNSKTGIAYQASQATGEIAVIDGATNKVLTYVDLTLNGDPQTPYQVAVDEAQNLIYVGAKSPEPEPNALAMVDGKYGCKAIRELPSDEVPAGQEPELDCWHPGPVIVIDGKTNKVVGSFLAGDDPEGVVFAKATGKVYASNEDDGTVTVAKGAIRNGDGSITPPMVLGTIIQGKLVAGRWEPTCDAKNYCGDRETLKAWLWPTISACHGIDDEAEEADKMAVDPAGNVYIIDDRYRVAKISGSTDGVVELLKIDGFDCEATVPNDSTAVFRNTANNIAYMPSGQGKLYVTSEQNTATLIQWAKSGKKVVTTLTTLTLPKAAHLDAITTDPALNQVYITDEELASLWILKGACANGTGNTCVP